MFCLHAQPEHQQLKYYQCCHAHARTLCAGTAIAAVTISHHHLGATRCVLCSSVCERNERIVKCGREEGARHRVLPHSHAWGVMQSAVCVWCVCVVCV